MELIGLGGEKYSGKNTAAKVLTDKYGFKEISLALPLKTLAHKVFKLDMDYFENPDLKEKPFESPIVLDNTIVQQIYEHCSWLINLDIFKKQKNMILEGMMYKAIDRKDKNQMISRAAIKMLSSSEGAYNLMPTALQFKSFNTPRSLLQFIGTELIRECISPYFWVKVLDEQISKEQKVVITDVRFFEEREYVKLKHGTLIKIERPSLTAGVTKKDAHASENSLGSNDQYHYIIRNTGTADELRGRLETVYTYSDLLRRDQIYEVRNETRNTGA